MLRKLVMTTAILTATVNAALAEMVLRRGNGAEPVSLDPGMSEGIPSSTILRDTFEGLITENPNGELVAGVAERWEVSEDGLRYVFHLRKGLTWSDGKALTTEDFVYAWQRAINPATGSKYAFVLFPIKNAEAINTGENKDLSSLGVKALDAQTLEVTLQAPTPYILGLFAFPTAYPVPKHVVEAKGDQWTRAENVVSNGAYKLTEWLPNSHITIEKSDAYWGKDAVKIDKVIYYPIEDQNSELSRYRAGEIDITNEVPNDQFKWVKQNLGDELRVANWLGTYYYGFNLTKPPFDNPDLRKALSLAINREVLVEQITGLGEVAAYGIVPVGVNGYENYQPDWAKAGYAENVKAAQALYAKAGYSKDKPLKVDILYNTSENHKKIAVAIAAMWEQALGVQATMTNMEWKVYLSERKNFNTQVFRAGWIGDYNDANSFLELFRINSEMNDLGYKDEQYDALLKQASEELDPIKRAAILRDAEKRFIDHNGLIPIYQYVSKHLVKPYVKGWQDNILDRVYSQHLSIER